MVSLENIEFITRWLWPLVINSIFLLVIAITTRDIFQYFLTAIKDSLNQFQNGQGSLGLQYMHIIDTYICNFFFEKSADWPKPVTRKIGQKNHKETDTTHI